MQGFVEASAAFRVMGVQLLGVSVDSYAAANAFANSLGADFPLLGDWPTYATCRAYGVYDEQRHVARRVTFVIDGVGIIQGVIDDASDMARHSREALQRVRALGGQPPSPGQSSA